MHCGAVNDMRQRCSTAQQTIGSGALTEGMLTRRVWESNWGHQDAYVTHMLTTSMQLSPAAPAHRPAIVNEIAESPWMAESIC